MVVVSTQSLKKNDGAVMRPCLSDMALIKVPFWSGMRNATALSSVVLTEYTVVPWFSVLMASQQAKQSFDFERALANFSTGVLMKQSNKGI